MKKTCLLLLALVIALGLCACGVKGGTPDGPGKATAVPGGENVTNDPAGTPADGAPTNGPADQTPEPVAGSEGLVIKEYDDNCAVDGIGTFSGTELIIPSHVNGKPVTSIYEDAISNNTMVSLVVPFTVVTIGEDAVSSSEKLETVRFSEGLISVGEGSFGGCPRLKSVTLPLSLESVYNSAFRDCVGLEEVVLYGNSNVYNYAFSNCTALKKVTFGGSSGKAYEIKSSVFDSDTALEELVFSRGLEKIGSFACSGCTALKAVYLPETLKEVAASAFSNVGTLKVFYSGSEEDWNKINFANGNDALRNAEIEFNYKLTPLVPNE